MLPDEENQKPTGNHPDLRDTKWQLIAMHGADIGAAFVLPATGITLQFEDQRIFGSAGCNRYMGSYAVDLNRISLAIGVPRASCPEPQMALERNYLAALPKSVTFEISKAIYTWSMRRAPRCLSSSQPSMFSPQAIVRIRHVHRSCGGIREPGAAASPLHQGGLETAFWFAFSRHAQSILAVSIQFPGLAIVGESVAQHLDQPLAQFRARTGVTSSTRRVRLRVRQSALPISVSGITVVVEIEDAVVFEEAPEDADHPDVVAVARQPRPQRAVSAHDEIDLHAGL